MNSTAGKGSPLTRLINFAAKPWRRQFCSFAFRWFRIFPGIPLPLRLSFRSWWLVRKDQIGGSLLQDTFEVAEHHFVERFLQPGMTALDIGANQGYYTLLASRKVGPQGKVLAFEPSTREIHRLKLHLRINRCKNVHVISSALGAAAGTEKLHVVLGSDSGCNSLRPPNVEQPTSLLSVPVQQLDEVLRARGVTRVDFIKLDVEGAELSVLQGARELLTHLPRPIILIEVQDLRTQPWGYPAREIISYLSTLGFEWFAPKAYGKIEKIAVNDLTYDGNFLAIPRESVNTLAQG